ncbi:MAG TPA: hypothetical protein VME44_10035, partial [Streptosporangiaceae bacterium]|nr:hypothetical protein [Streptosporangiaceae bacterium]
FIQPESSATASTRQQSLTPIRIRQRLWSRHGPELVADVLAAAPTVSGSAAAGMATVHRHDDHAD